MAALKIMRLFVSSLMIRAATLHNEVYSAVDAHVGAWWQLSLLTATDAPPRHDKFSYAPQSFKTEP
ncbi:MAG: hypothetical protein IKJ38_00565 [Alistipes sp.]|nr:hypothetical protein [Alistipes sp.]